MKRNDEQKNGGAERVPGRVWNAALLLSAGRIWGSGCTAAILILLARHLPGAQFGRYTFYLALFLLLEGLADFGTGAAAVQRSADDRRLLPGAIAAGRRIRLVTAGGGFAVVALCAWALDEAGGGWVALAALAPLTRRWELSSVVWQREIAWSVPVAVRVLTAAVRLALALLLCNRGVETFGPYLLAHAATLAASNLALHRLARTKLPPTDEAVVPMRGFLAAALPLGLAGLFSQAYFYLDNLFVRGICGEVETGRYNAAARIMTFLVMVAAHATTAALPWLTRRRSGGDLGAATDRLGLPLFSGACVVLGALWPWSDRILAGLFGEEFASAGDSLRWLLVGAAIIHAGAGWLTAVIASGAMRTVLAITATAVAVNLLGNAWLVPGRGIEGAAIATVGTELLVAGGALLALHRGGARPLARPLAWLAGPLGFLLSAWISGELGGTGS
jgi:O-antigen/teichoic acid export membrane protein